MSSSRRAPGVIESFNYAFEGIIHVLRTQRNLRIHFAIAVAHRDHLKGRVERVALVDDDGAGRSAEGAER